MAKSRLRLRPEMTAKLTRGGSTCVRRPLPYAPRAQHANPERFMRYPPFDGVERRIALESDDPVRYATIMLAINALRSRGVSGAFAELGVYRGDASRAIHTAAPERRLYLFDTFDGFP